MVLTSRLFSLDSKFINRDGLTNETSGLAETLCCDTIINAGAYEIILLGRKRSAGDMKGLCE